VPRLPPWFCVQCLALKTVIFLVAETTQKPRGNATDGSSDDVEDDVEDVCCSDRNEIDSNVIDDEHDGSNVGCSCSRNSKCIIKRCNCRAAQICCGRLCSCKKTNCANMKPGNY
jgi:hypothetical protein